MKIRSKIILSVLLAVVCVFSCGCNTTNSSLYNVYVAFEKDASELFDWEITRANGSPCYNARKGDELVFTVKRNSLESDKIYYVSSVDVDGENKSVSNDGKGSYTLAFTMLYDSLKIALNIGVNEISFLDESVKEMFDVYFTDENGEVFDHAGKGEKRFLNVTRSGNYDLSEKDYYVGYAVINGETVYSEEQDVEHFKKEIFSDDDDFVFELGGQFVYYQFSHPSVAKNFDVILKNEAGQRVGRFKQGDFLTVSVKKNTAGIRHFVYKIIVDGEQLYYSDGGAEAVYFEAKSELFELKQDELTIKIVFGVDEIVSRD